MLLFLFSNCNGKVDNKGTLISERKIELSRSNFKNYIMTLDQIPTPLKCNPKGQLPRFSTDYDKEKFEFYKHTSTSQPLGIYYQDDKTVGIIDCYFGDWGLVPFLTTYDLNGNKIDSTSFYELSGSDMGYEGIEHLTFTSDKTIIMLDTLKRWEIDKEKSTVKKGSMNITYGKMEYRILENGKIKKKRETNIFELSTIPKRWVQLTEKDEKLIIYNSCDAGNLLITISDIDEEKELLLHGQQEDDHFIISTSHKANESIFINANRMDSNKKQTFKFTWIDKLNGIGRWETTYSNGTISDNIFVTNEHQLNFETVDQPCKECWGEECDEE